MEEENAKIKKRESIDKVKGLLGILSDAECQWVYEFLSELFLS